MGINEPVVVFGRVATKETHKELKSPKTSKRTESAYMLGSKT